MFVKLLKICVTRCNIKANIRSETPRLDDIDKKIIEKYLELSADQRQVLKEYLKSIFT